MDNTVLTVADVAKYLHVHTSTIYRMLKQQKLPAFRVGSDWRFRRDEIDQWRKELSDQTILRRGR